MDAFSKYGGADGKPYTDQTTLVNQCSSQFTYVYVGPEPDLLLFVVGLVLQRLMSIGYPCVVYTAVPFSVARPSRLR